MSIPVALDDLWGALAERDARAYLLTVSDAGGPHAVHVAVTREDDRLVVDVGRRSAANAVARSSVSLLYPIRSVGDYSLIVDGAAVVDGRRLWITPTKAVLHRPASAPAPAAACGADCVPLATVSRPGR